jgi:hypothetical protein
MHYYQAYYFINKLYSFITPALFAQRNSSAIIDLQFIFGCDLAGGVIDNANSNNN